MAETSLEAATRSLGARIDPVFELFDYLKDVLFWVKDKKGIFRWVNTTLMLHIGRSSRDQIIGRTDFDLFEPYLANQYQMDDAQVLRGRAITSRVEMIVFHHTPRWIVTSKLPVRNASGRIVAHLQETSWWQSAVEAAAGGLPLQGAKLVSSLAANAVPKTWDMRAGFNRAILSIFNASRNTL